jgi:hypothetical protein
MLVESAVLKKIEPRSSSIFKLANIPLRADLWGEHQYDFGQFSEPTVFLVMTKASTFPIVLTLSLDTFGQRYVEGGLDIAVALRDAGLEKFDVENRRRYSNRILLLWAKRYKAATARVGQYVERKTCRILRAYIAVCAHVIAIAI